MIEDPGYAEIVELKGELARLQMQNFLYDDLHKWTWWLSLGVTVIPLVVWWKVVDRRRILEISLFGMFLLTMATFFDVAGNALNLWSYPDKLLPFLPVIPFDFVVIPVAYMLIYQKFVPWKEFVIASTILAAAYAFIAEPLTVWLNLSVFLQWKYAYSFPIYIGMAVFARWLVGRFKARQD